MKFFKSFKISRPIVFGNSKCRFSNIELSEKLERLEEQYMSYMHSILLLYNKGKVDEYAVYLRWQMLKAWVEALLIEWNNIKFVSKTNRRRIDKIRHNVNISPLSFL